MSKLHLVFIAAILAVTGLVGCGGSDNEVGMDPLMVGDWHLVSLSYGGFDEPVLWAKNLNIEDNGDYEIEWFERGLHAKDKGRMFVRSHDYIQQVWETSSPQPTEYIGGNQHEGTYTIDGDTLTFKHELFEFPDTEVIEVYSRGADRVMRDTDAVGRWRQLTRTVNGEVIDVNWEKIVQIDADGDYYADWNEHGLTSSDLGVIRLTDSRYEILITERSMPDEADLWTYLGPYEVVGDILALAFMEADDKITLETYERIP